MVWTVDMDDFKGDVCGGNVKYPLIGAMREELLGISRGKEAKDVDWSEVASTFEDQEEVIFVFIAIFGSFTELLCRFQEELPPQAIKIDVSEVLQKVRKSKVKVKSGLANVEKNCKEACKYLICDRLYLFHIVF